MFETADPNPLIESFGRNLQKCAKAICSQQATCTLVIEVTGTINPLEEQSLMVSDRWRCVSGCPLLEDEDLRRRAREKASNDALIELGIDGEVDYSGMYGEQQL